jgi:hypothetical protein
MPFPAMQLVYPSFLRIQVAALPKNIAGQIVGAPAFLLSLDTLSDDLELPPAPLAGSKRIAAERNQAERRGALDRFARRIVSEVEIETADLRLRRCGGPRSEVQGDGVRFVVLEASPRTPLIGKGTEAYFPALAGIGE